MEALQHYQGGDVQGGSTLTLRQNFDALIPGFPQQRQTETLREYSVKSPHGRPAFYEVGQLALDFSEPCEPIPDSEGRSSPEEIRMTHSLLGAIVQVLDGRRRLLTIEPALSVLVRESLKTRLQHGSAKGEPGRLLTVHTYKPTKRAIEACATVHRTRCAQAMIARLESRHRLWSCTLLRLA